MRACACGSVARAHARRPTPVPTSGCLSSGLADEEKSTMSVTFDRELQRGHELEPRALQPPPRRAARTSLGSVHDAGGELESAAQCEASGVRCSLETLVSGIDGMTPMPRRARRMLVPAPRRPKALAQAPAPAATVTPAASLSRDRGGASTDGVPVSPWRARIEGLQHASSCLDRRAPERWRSGGSPSSRHQHQHQHRR